MSAIIAIQKLDERKSLEDQLAKFYAKGGEVKRLPQPTCESEAERWLDVLPASRKARMKRIIAKKLREEKQT